VLKVLIQTRVLTLFAATIIRPVLSSLPLWIEILFCPCLLVLIQAIQDPLDFLVDLVNIIDTISLNRRS
jgi:hypothetical protein